MPAVRFVCGRLGRVVLVLEEAVQFVRAVLVGHPEIGRASVKDDIE